MSASEMAAPIAAAKEVVFGTIGPYTGQSEPEAPAHRPGRRRRLPRGGQAAIIRVWRPFGWKQRRVRRPTTPWLSCDNACLCLTGRGPLPSLASA
jgi:hypothetical protein